MKFVLHEKVRPHAGPCPFVVSGIGIDEVPL
jgi:hypothetical protein